MYMTVTTVLGDNPQDPSKFLGGHPHRKKEFRLSERSCHTKTRWRAIKKDIYVLLWPLQGHAWSMNPDTHAHIHVQTDIHILDKIQKRLHLNQPSLVL